MDAYEATKIVFQRIQTMDPENASKIMGLLLIQEHGEKEMIRLAFGPETQINSVILKARKELGLSSPNTPPTPSSPSPFTNPLSLSRQNSCSSASSRLLNAINLPSPLSMTNTSSTAPSSWTNSTFSDFQNPDDLTTNSSAAPFYGEVDLIDELQLQDQLSFLNDGYPQQQQDLTGNDAMMFPPYGFPHRRSCSVSDICVGDDLSGGFGWKPCLYYARGYCKNGTSCRFLHGEATAAEGGALVGSPSQFEIMEQCHELMRSKSAQQQRLTAASQLMASANFAYSTSPTSKFVNFLQLPTADSPRFGRGRFERGDFGIIGGPGIVNPSSRQIYLTFPADSTFKEEDVSNYFSIFGPVQDVRIPYQQKRMFGFVTFEYPDTVKLILAKGNPHFVCDARVLVKPYKEKGKIPDKHRKHQQQMEMGEFTTCGSPTGLESRDPYDLQLGARMLYNTHDMLWRRKLEEHADLQQAIELQNRRFMGLQLLDVKGNGHNRALSNGAIASPTYSSSFFRPNGVLSSDLYSPQGKEENGSSGIVTNPPNVSTGDQVVPLNVNVNAKEKYSFVKSENGNGKEIDSQESLEHNLPDSPFASPKATIFSNDVVETEKGSLVSSTNNNLITGFKSCYFQVPRFASGHETIGM